jgi:nucleoid DNA-binding protein
MGEEKKPLTKAQFLQAVADESGTTKADVAAMWDAMTTVIRKQIGKNRRGPGAVTLPGLVKITKQKKPARPAKKGVPNPFKPGELMDVAAKPASTVVKVRPLKALKDMV